MVMPMLPRLHHLGPRRITLADTFATSFCVLALIAVLARIARWQIKGPDAFRASFESDLELLLFLAPRFGAAIPIAELRPRLFPELPSAKDRDAAHDAR